jgi:hypothetical protein
MGSSGRAVAAALFDCLPRAWPCPERVVNAPRDNQGGIARFQCILVDVKITKYIIHFVLAGFAPGDDACLRRAV